MKKLQETIITKQTLSVALMFVFGAALLPFFVLSLFNHPSPWDDYSVANLVKERGYVGFYLHFLQHWNGRYVSTLLQGLNPLAFDNFHMFRVVPMLFMGGFIGALYFFVKRLTADVLSQRWQWVVTLGYCAVFFAYVRSAVELWYWHSSSVVYGTAFIAVWLLLGLSMPLLAGNSLTPKEQLAACGIGVLLPGISESVAISALAFAGAAMLLRLWQPADPERKMAVTQWLAVAASIGLGLLLFASLGGTQARMGIYQQAFQWESLRKALQIQLPIIASWLNNTTLWILSLLVIPGIAGYMQQIPSKHFLRMHPVLMTALLPLMMLASVIPYYMVTGLTYIYVRIENIAFFWFLLLWFANIACWVGYLQNRWHVHWGQIPVYALVVLLAMGCLKLYSPNTKVGVAWMTLLNGDAVRYEKDHQERYRRIAQYKKEHRQDTLTLPPIDTHMELLMFEELTTDAGHTVSNQGFAKYFGISAVKVQ
ncbi:hypothetical protein [Rhodoflexus sp.]